MAGLHWSTINKCSRSSHVLNMLRIELWYWALVKFPVGFGVGSYEMRTLYKSNACGLYKWRSFRTVEITSDDTAVFSWRVALVRFCKQLHYITNAPDTIIYSEFEFLNYCHLFHGPRGTHVSHRDCSPMRARYGMSFVHSFLIFVQWSWLECSMYFDDMVCTQSSKLCSRKPQLKVENGWTIISHRLMSM